MSQHRHKRQRYKPPIPKDSLYCVVDTDYVEYKIQCFGTRLRAVDFLPISSFKNQLSKLKARLTALTKIIDAWDGLVKIGAIPGVDQQEIRSILEEKDEILNTLDTLHFKLDIHIKDCEQEFNYNRQVRFNQPLSLSLSNCGVHGSENLTPTLMTPISQRLQDFTSSTLSGEMMEISGESRKLSQRSF